MNQTNKNLLFINKSKSPISISYNSEKKYNKSIDSPFKFSLTLLQSKNNNEQRIKEKCWEILTNFIITNYILKKGTRIKNFGIFTFLSSNNTHQNDNTNLNDIPIFLINDNFINNIKPGIYDKKNGLTEFTNKKYLINNNIEICDVNYEKLSKKVNISKEKFENNISNIIEDMKGKIKQEIFNAKKMEGLGIFLKRGNIFGMRFENINNNNNFNETTKNNYHSHSTKISLRKNIYNLNKIKKKYENNHHNNNDLFPKTEYNSDFLVNSPLIKGIKFKLKGHSNKNDNIYRNITLSDNNDTLDKVKNSFRNFTLLKLKNLNIDSDVLENICNSKDMLIKKIKEENNDNDFIEKEKLINYILDFNQSLDYETINKIINIYINDNKDNLNNIEYTAIINKICNDVKKIIENKKNINKNINSLDNNIYNALKNKSIIKNNILLPNIKIIDNNNKTNDNILTQEELYKIKNIIASYSKEKYINLITYKEFNI